MGLEQRFSVVFPKLPLRLRDVARGIHVRLGVRVQTRKKSLRRCIQNNINQSASNTIAP